MSKQPEPDDIPAHEDVIFDLSTSCTKEQAVMRLLGWVKGDVFKRYVQITEDGISAKELNWAHPTTMTLAERLQDMAEHAQMALIRGAENGVSHEELDHLHGGVDEVRQLASKTKNLLMDLDDELAKGQDSLLRLDPEATKRSGVPHINIRSLEKWAASANSASETGAQPHAHMDCLQHTDRLDYDQSLANTKAEPNPARPVTRIRMLEQGDAILRAIKELGYSPDSLLPGQKGKRGVKYATRNKLTGNPLFKARRSFDKAWEQLRKEGAIAEQS
jgi:hypothetical protein